MSAVGPNPPHPAMWAWKHQLTYRMSPAMPGMQQPCSVSKQHDCSPHASQYCPPNINKLCDTGSSTLNMAIINPWLPAAVLTSQGPAIVLCKLADSDGQRRKLCICDMQSEIVRSGQHYSTAKLSDQILTCYNQSPTLSQQFRLRCASKCQAKQR